MSNRFQFLQTPLLGVWISERKVFKDDRGSFSRLFCADEFRQIDMVNPIVQINYSISSVKGTVRGLHFQHTPYAETKVISCLKGEVFDVAVDLRHGSKTFLSWFGTKLSQDNQNSIIIPEGFAHGFQALTDHCELIYFHTKFYTPQSEDGFNVMDHRIGIDWPLPVKNLSESDKNRKHISEDYDGIKL